MQSFSKTLEFKWGTAFIAVALIYVITAFVNNSFILTESYYYNLLGSRLDGDRIQEIFAMNRKYQWLAYLIQPIFLLLKLTIIAGVVYAGIVLFNYTLAFKTIFKVTILAESIVALAGVVKSVWILFNGFNDINSIKSFYPLSIVNLLNISKIPSYLVFPLQQLNLFELCYWLFFSFWLKMLLNKSYGKSISVFAYSYGVSYLIWIIAIVFIQIQFS